MQGQFPKYNQLIPQTFPKEAVVNKSDLIAALERVAVMVNEKNSIVKFEFADNTLNSPEIPLMQVTRRTKLILNI